MKFILYIWLILMTSFFAMSTVRAEEECMKIDAANEEAEKFALQGGFDLRNEVWRGETAQAALDYTASRMKKDSENVDEMVVYYLTKDGITEAYVFWAKKGCVQAIVVFKNLDNLKEVLKAAGAKEAKA